MLVATVSALAVLTGCSSEPATLVDLNTTTTATAGTSTDEPVASADFGEVDPDGPNAEAQQQVIDAARQQCLDDLTQEEGIVQIVLESTGEVASEYRVSCDEVRAEADADTDTDTDTDTDAGDAGSD